MNTTQTTHKRFHIPNSLIYLGLTAVAFLAHWNLFLYPAYREDEGTYVAQAWAVINSGQLAPYTYWYDHAPVGWFFIAGWNLLTSGFGDFGNSINSGRVFIMLLNIVSTLLVYKISKQFTQSRLFSFFAALLFILTPLGISFQRRVFLDNIMVFWLLISLSFSFHARKLYNVILSAVTFAISVLSKETAIVFLPVILMGIYSNSHKNNRSFIISSWLVFSLSIISFYPLYALIKGEFFPYGSWLGGREPHVSLLEALTFQTGRSQGPFWDPNSALQRIFKEAWMPQDLFLLITGGLIAPLINIIAYRKYKWVTFNALLVFIYIAYLLRGQVLDWYIIPIIPLAVINLAILLHNVHITVKKHLPKLDKVYLGITSALLIVAIGFGVYKNIDAYKFNQTENQRRSTQWIKSYIQNDTSILIDNFAFTDLNPNLKNITDTRIHYFWKADDDPQIANDVFKNNWKNIDYIMVTPAMLKTLEVEDFPMVETALANSELIIKYNEYAVAGDPDANYPVEIREVRNFDKKLTDSWNTYKSKFITPEGRVIDPMANNITTSEGQSYALLRAMWQNDRVTFDKTLEWSLAKLKKSDSHLMAWKYGTNDNGSEGILDNTSATDADVDIAFALLQASIQWQSEQYKDLAMKMIKDIWTKNVVKVGDTHYLVASDNAVRNGSYLINPSYFSPAMYRAFALYTPDLEWNKLAEDTYKTINQIKNPGTGLIANWTLLNADGSFSSAVPYTSPEAEYFGYDAFRLQYRVKLDAMWYNNQQAKDYLQEVRTKFVIPEWQRFYNFASVYTVDGRRLESYNDVSTKAAWISALAQEEGELDTEVYLSSVGSQYYTDHWADSKNYYDQNWGWFTTALYSNSLPNYFAKNNESN